MATPQMYQLGSGKKIPQPGAQPAAQPMQQMGQQPQGLPGVPTPAATGAPASRYAEFLTAIGGSAAVDIGSVNWLEMALAQINAGSIPPEWATAVSQFTQQERALFTETLLNIKKNWNNMSEDQKNQARQGVPIFAPQGASAQFQQNTNAEIQKADTDLRSEIDRAGIGGVTKEFQELFGAERNKRMNAIRKARGVTEKGLGEDPGNPYVRTIGGNMVDPRTGQLVTGFDQDKNPVYKKPEDPASAALAPGATPMNEPQKFKPPGM